MNDAAIKVLIIDDSALVRDLLSSGLGADPHFEVVGTAPDVYVGRDKIVRLGPQVVTLDIEMPRMDGIEFLRRLMPQYPLPVVVVSALAAPGAATTLEALELGAVDFVLKPSTLIGSGLDGMLEELKAKICVAATVDVTRFGRVAAPTARHPTAQVLVGTTDKVIAVGASTGGTVALKELIQQFPADMPGTVVVQHMPPVFTRLFAERLNQTARVEVREACSGDRVVTGTVLIAPGGQHLEMVRSGGSYLVRCREGEKVNGHCPSVDVLLLSVATAAGPNAVGVMLTGMGSDGADGLLAMRNAGARTIAQDEATSVVFGMPRVAYERGGAEHLVALPAITGRVLNALSTV